MVRVTGLFSMLVLLSTCNSDEGVQPIGRYRVAWETNLMERYAQYEPLPPVTGFFSFVFANPNGSIYVIHSPENLYDVTTVTLLDAEGEFVSDITLNGEYVFNVSENQQGLMQTLARSGDDYLIKTWDENLNATVLKVMSIPDYFHQILIWKNFYYKTQFDFDVRTFTISKYDMNDILQWSHPFAGYKIIGYATPVFFPHSDDFLLSRPNLSYDSIRFVKVSGQSGIAVWNRSFAFSEISTPPGSMPAVFPVADGQALIFNKFDYLVQSRNGFTLYAGRLKNTSSIPESPVRAVIQEPDNGYLIATSFFPEEGWGGFRLLKTDAKFNVRWVGSFHQAVSGYLSSWARHNDTVVLLTSNGYVYAIKPAE